MRLRDAIPWGLLKTAAGALVLAFAALPAAAQSWQPADGARLEFDVFRDGGAFGTHVVAFDREGGSLTVDTDIQLRVGLGPITLFEYRHDVTERYQDGRLVWVSSRTLNEGKWKTLTAQDVQGGLKVNGSAFRGLLSSPVIPSTHWNQEEMMQAAMFSTETGGMLPIRVKDMGLEQVKVGAATVTARRYFVDSEIDASFWYDAQGRWVKCAFETQGSKIEYVLRRLPA
jgi:hypothetical protein